MSPGCAGSVMVGLILAMMTMAALGTAMLSLTGTAVINPVDAIRTAQARYLAEAGVRYVETAFRNPVDLNVDGVTDEADINLGFEQLHNQSRVLRDDQGRFNIGVYPCFVVTNYPYPVGTLSFAARFPGGHRPADQTAGFTIPSTGRLKVGADFYAFTSHNYNPVTGVVSFALQPSLSRSIARDRRILFAAQAAGGTLATQPGSGVFGSLILDSTGEASVFPPKNGAFTIATVAGTFRYKTRSGTTLQHITDRDNPERAFSLTIPTGQKIALEPFVDIVSTGVHGQAPELVRHETVFHVPIPTEQRVQVTDSFEDMSRWRQSTLGSHNIETIGGDKALRVTGAEAGAGGVPRMSQIAFNPAAVNLDLTTYQQQAGRFLSYDCQIKVGFAASAQPPTQGYDDTLGQGPPVPKYFAGGLSLRLSDITESATFLGLSFLRGDNTLPWPYDNLPDEIVPLNGKPLIVLWQQKAGGTRNWLAYKELIERGFSDNVEADEYVWTYSGTPTPSGLWHISTRKSPAGSPTHAWYYGQEATGNYNTGATNAGTLVSPDINLAGASAAVLTYWSWHRTEVENPGTFDVKTVEVSEDGGSTWLRTVDTVPGTFLDWHLRTVNLSASLGKIIKLRFKFDTRDALYNAYEGWYVDDPKIRVTMPSLSTDYKYVSALALRLIEGASVAFTNGGPTAIRDGDIVTQGAGVQAAVKGDPIKTAGTWAAGNAAGTLVLKKVTAPFAAGQNIAVVGSSTTAAVTAYRAKDNYIRAYYGMYDTTDSGTPNAVATDLNKRGNPRGQVNWPPDTLAGWTSGTDYFRQIRWDAVNTANVANLARLVSRNEDGSEKEVVVGTADDTFKTPDTGTLAQPEFGLHSLGHGATNIFFDDFAVQLDANSKKGFPYSIQE